jgi:hypothetical protein
MLYSPASSAIPARFTLPENVLQHDQAACEKAARRRKYRWPTKA